MAHVDAQGNMVFQKSAFESLYDTVTAAPSPPPSTFAHPPSFQELEGSLAEDIDIAPGEESEDDLPEEHSFSDGQLAKNLKAFSHPTGRRKYGKKLPPPIVRTLKHSSR